VHATGGSMDTSDDGAELMSLTAHLTLQHWFAETHSVRCLKLLLSLGTRITAGSVTPHSQAHTLMQLFATPVVSEAQSRTIATQRVHAQQAQENRRRCQEIRTLGAGAAGPGIVDVHRRWAEILEQQQLGAAPE